MGSSGFGSRAAGFGKTPRAVRSPSSHMTPPRLMPSTGPPRRRASDSPTGLLVMLSIGHSGSAAPRPWARGEVAERHLVVAALGRPTKSFPHPRLGRNVRWADVERLAVDSLAPGPRTAAKGRPIGSPWRRIDVAYSAFARWGGGTASEALDLRRETGHAGFTLLILDVTEASESGRTIDRRPLGASVKAVLLRFCARPMEQNAAAPPVANGAPG